jgi:hypothetical protein
MLEHTFVARERRSVGWLVAALAVGALMLGAVLPIPHKLPSVALGSDELLLLERSLAFFYGALLFMVPVVRALEGQLPIELSARGARWQESTAVSERALITLNARVQELEAAVEDLAALVPALERAAENEEQQHREVN